MSDSFLRDEQKVSDDRQRDDLLAPSALQEPLSELSELQPVVSLPPQATVRQAVEQMRVKRVGIVLVVDGEKLTGVFSERDVLRKVVGEDVDLDATPLSELMTENPECLHAENPLVYALHQMSVGGYRHIPLVDGEGCPVAVVSMRDIVGHIAALYPDQVVSLPGHPSQSIPSTREGA